MVLDEDQEVGRDEMLTDRRLIKLFTEWCARKSLSAGDKKLLKELLEKIPAVSKNKESKLLYYRCKSAVDVDQQANQLQSSLRASEKDRKSSPQNFCSIKGFFFFLIG